MIKKSGNFLLGRVLRIFAVLALSAAPMVAATVAGAALPGQYSVTVSPTTVAVGQVSNTFTFTNTTVPSSQFVMNVATLTVPSGGPFTLASATISQQPLARAWSATFSGGVVTLRANGVTDGLLPGESVSVTVGSTAADIPGAYTWATTASNDMSSPPTAFQLSGSQPKVTLVNIFATCPAGQACDEELPSSVGTVRMDVESGTQDESYDFSIGGLFSAPACGGSFAPQGEPIRTNVYSTTRGHTITVTIPKPRNNDNGASHWGVCFASDRPFVDSSGNLVMEGLLPRCSDPLRPPCILALNRNHGNQIVKYIAPAGDPISIPGLDGATASPQL